MTLAQVRRYALSLPGVTEEPHFDRTSFRVNGKILATAKLPDFNSRQVDLLIFMQIYGPTIDPGIERCVKPGAGLKGYGWDGDVPPEHSPLFDAYTMIGRLQDLVEQVTEKHGIPPILRAHIPALAAMKLISSGHKSGLLDDKVGKALARFHMAAGCRTAPVPIHGK